MPSMDASSLDLILSSLERYTRTKLPPEVLRSLDAKDQFPQEVIDDLYDPERVGLHLLFIPEEYGGLGAGAYDIYRVAETMAGVDLGISTGILATFLGTDPIAVGGTERQKAHWMTRIADERLLVAYGATEPGAGSDLGALKTRAVPVHEGDRLVGYRLSGQKQWISNGGVAALYTVLANAPGGPSWFIVERGAPGFSWGAPEDKHGIRASNTAALFLDDVLVQPEALIGEVEGRGLAQAQAVFGYTRLMVAAFGLGAGWSALGRAIRYAQQRVQGGSALSQKQGYTHKLIVPNAARLEAARAYVELTAERLDDGEPGLATEGAIAKYMATEAGNHAAEDAIQALGGYGYTKEYMVEKIKRDVRITTIYEGTSEILEWTIARDRWQLHLKSRGEHYREWAARLEALDRSDSTSGAGIAALGLGALAAVLERCRVDRLTRNQHVLFRLGELVAHAECAAVFSERVLTKPTRAMPFNGETSRVLARIFARDAAAKIACDGLRWASAASAASATSATSATPRAEPELASTLRYSAIFAAQAGLLDDMSFAAERLVAAFPPE
jgi:alkylation response protein AidB-like acyl-CoA dehydrogenase